MLPSPTPLTSVRGFWKSTWWIWKSLQPWRTTTMEDLHDGLARAWQLSAAVLRVPAARGRSAGGCDRPRSLPVIPSPYQMKERWGSPGSLRDGRAGVGPQEELLKGLNSLMCPAAWRTLAMHNGWDADYFPSIPVGLRTACCLLLRKEEGGKKKRKWKTNPVKCSDVVITEQFLGFERLVCTLPLCRSNKAKYKVIIKKKRPPKIAKRAEDSSLLENQHPNQV